RPRRLPLLRRHHRIRRSRRRGSHAPSIRASARASAGVAPRPRPSHAPRISRAACPREAIAAGRRRPRWRRRSPSSNGPSSRSKRRVRESGGRLLAAAVLVGLDEDVDLVGALVALLIGHRERGGVLADLVVGVHRILIGALATVAEVPGELPRSAFLF